MDEVAHRRQFGHPEGDLMLFKQKLGQTNVTSLVERVSRFTVLLKNPNVATKLKCPPLCKVEMAHLAVREQGWAGRRRHISEH